MIIPIVQTGKWSKAEIKSLATVEVIVCPKVAWAPSGFLTVSMTLSRQASGGPPRSQPVL